MGSPRAASASARLLVVTAVATSLLHTAAATGACGTSPKVIYVNEGEKRRVRFWNTDSVEAPQAENETLEGSGDEPELQPLASIVAAGITEATGETLGAAETTPFVVTPAGPEVATRPSEPLDDTLPHIVLPEPQQDSFAVNQDTSTDYLSGTGAVQESAVVQLEDTKADAENEDEQSASSDSLVSDTESDNTDGGSGGDIELTTEREYLTTFDPFDLVAIANKDVQVNGQQKRIPLVTEESGEVVEGSGKGSELPPSATIPLNKYEEITISSDHSDTVAQDFTNSGISPGSTVILEDITSDQAAGLDRLIDVTGFSGDRVLVEWTPDEEASGEPAVQDDDEGSGILDINVGDVDKSVNVLVAVPDDQTSKQSSKVVESYDSSLSLQDFAAELPLTMIESGPVEALSVESNEIEQDTDELLPMKQPNSVHQVFSSLKPASDQNLPNETPVHSSSHTDYTSDPSTSVRVQEDKSQEENSEGSETQLDRLLLIQSFTSDNRVILEHIPDISSGSGSGQGDGSDEIASYTTFEPLEGSGLDQEFHYEASGESLDSDPKETSSKVINNWVAKEKHSVMTSASRTEIPDLKEVEIASSEIPGLKESGLPVASVEVGGSSESLPLAETEGFPQPESPSESDNNKEEQEKSEQELETADDNSTEQEAEVEESKASSEETRLPIADTEAVSADSETVSITAANERSNREGTAPLSRQTLLNSIYRLLDTRHPRPSRFTEHTRPSWAGFGALRRSQYSASPLRTEKPIITSSDSTVLSGPSFYPVLDLARNRRVRSVRGLPSRPEQQDSVFDAAQSLRHPDDQLFRFIRSQPYPLMSALLNGWPRLRSSRLSSTAVDCEWQIKTEPHLYLLVTLNNLGAPYTVNCDGAYIEVERERDGFEARWCGNRIKQSGSRPHMVFARGEVRIAVFNDGDTTDLPTGFEADVEVVDLVNARQYSTLRRSELSVRRLGQAPVW